MSSEHWGRSSRSNSDSIRDQQRRENDQLRSANTALQQQANRLGSDVAQLHDQLAGAQNDLRKAAEIRARIEQKQREFETIQQQMQRRHQEFVERTRQREQELEQEIRATGEQTGQKIEELRAETDQEVNRMQQEMNDGLKEVRAEMQETERQLDGQIQNTRQEIDRERQRRVEKESNRTAQATSLAEWVETQLAQLQDVDALGLTMERTRVQQSLDLARERLKTSDQEMALAAAETAFANYQTAHLETERRIGEINGVAEHIQETNATLSAIAANEHLRMIFPKEAAQIEMAVEELRARAQGWRAQRRWTVFDYERDKVVDIAHEMLARATELESSVTGMLKQLQSREQKIKQVTSAVASVAGAADSIELGYANPDDVKSARLVRARIGKASIDTYLELDGGYRVDTYGFDSAAQCSEMAPRFQRKLAEEWTVAGSRIDPSNPQQPSVAPPPAAGETWQAASSEFDRLSQTIAGLSKNQ